MALRKSAVRVRLAPYNYRKFLDNYLIRTLDRIFRMFLPWNNALKSIQKLSAINQLLIKLLYGTGLWCY